MGVYFSNSAFPSLRRPLRESKIDPSLSDSPSFGKFDPWNVMLEVPPSLLLLYENSPFLIGPSLNS